MREQLGVELGREGLAAAGFDDQPEGADADVGVFVLRARRAVGAPCAKVSEKLFSLLGGPGFGARRARERRGLSGELAELDAGDVVAVGERGEMAHEEVVEGEFAAVDGEGEEGGGEDLGDRGGF
jgi:hypothetical protein